MTKPKTPGRGTPARVLVAGAGWRHPLQIADGAGGSLVTTAEECAAAIVALLRDPAQAEELGRRDRKRVRDHFLLPRLLLKSSG